MEVFQNLEVTGGAPSLERLMEAVEGSLSQGWSRDRQRELLLRRTGSTPGYCFFRSKQGKRPAVHLYVAWADQPSRLYVSNIVPAEGAIGLSRRQYNHILTEFYSSCLGPAVEKAGGVEARLSPSRRNIRDVLGRESAEALEQFCAHANRSVLLQLDKQRWFRFLIAAHREPDLASLYEDDLLERWLVEEQKFPEATADDLVKQIEFAEDLLKAYDPAS